MVGCQAFSKPAVAAHSLLPAWPATVLCLLSAESHAHTDSAGPLELLTQTAMHHTTPVCRPSHAHPPTHLYCVEAHVLEGSQPGPPLVWGDPEVVHTARQQLDRLPIQQKPVVCDAERPARPSCACCLLLMRACLRRLRMLSCFLQAVLRWSLLQMVQGLAGVAHPRSCCAEWWSQCLGPGWRVREQQEASGSQQR